MDAYLRRLSRPVRRLVAVPFAPASGLAWLAGKVMVRLVQHGSIIFRPQDVTLFRGFAEWALRRGESWSAAFFARYVIAAEPRAPDGYYLLHRAYLRAGKRTQAHIALEEGLRFAPADTQLRLARAAFDELGQGSTTAKNGVGTRR